VPADVQERPELAVFRPGDDHRHVTRTAREIRPRLGHLAEVPDVLPAPPEDRVLLTVQDLRLEIPIPGECSFHATDDISVQ
jgi:hypothetical protein